MTVRANSLGQRHERAVPVPGRHVYSCRLVNRSRRRSRGRRRRPEHVRSRRYARCQVPCAHQL